jgi:inner membrane protein
MTGRTHDAIAFASLITIAAVNPPESLNIATATAAVVGNIIGATLPDIDQSTNRLWDLLPGRDYVGKLLRPLFLGHRNLTHSFLGVFLIYHLLGFILPRLLNPSYVNINIIYAAMMIGYVSHLVGDAVTKEGLPLLFPFKWRFGFPPLAALRITTGKWIENIIILPGTAAYIFWFIGNHQGEFMRLLKLITG